MRLCFGTYAQVLAKCRKTGISQVRLGRCLMSVINDDRDIFYSDSSISDLFNGRKNLGTADVECALSRNPDEANTSFSENVMPLLDSGKVALAVAGVRELIISDSTIPSSTKVDLVSGMSKDDLSQQSMFAADAFLTGVLLYVSSSVSNRDTNIDCKSVDEGFVQRIRKVAESVVLVKSPIDAGIQAVTLWKRGQNSLMAVSGDIFTLTRGQENGTKKICVIPVDTSFCVKLSSDLEDLEPGNVSENTLHGKLLVRLYAEEETPESLAGRIWTNLSKWNDDIVQNSHVAPIGSVAVIEHQGTVYYLLAISEMDKKGTTRSSQETVSKSLKELIRFYDRHGQGYPLFVPLIGTGRSRAQLSNSESFETVKSVLEECADYIQGQVSIVALPDVWKELGICEKEN